MPKHHNERMAMNVKTKRQWTMLGSMAALSFGLATGLQAQEAEGKVKIGGAESKATVNVDKDKDRDRNLDQTDRHLDRSERKTGISKFNKASGLIGMNVHNSQGENLGEIKDLVLDLHSGKVSYAVLSVGGFLGIGDKFIAVPPSVFTMGADDKLVLNADKAKLQQAPGFAKNNWPDVENPSWGAFWGVNERGSIKGDVDVRTDKYQNRDRDRDLNRDRNLDRNRNLDRDATPKP
jgi:sporulation protein YlmC with PRC-barrel domain